MTTMRVFIFFLLLLTSFSAHADDFTGTFILDSKIVVGTFKVKRFEDSTINFWLNVKNNKGSCTVHDSLFLKNRSATFIDESALCKLKIDFGINQVTISAKNCAHFCSGESVKYDGVYKKTSNESQ